MDCSMEKRLYHRETANGRGHYQILGANNTSDNLRLVPMIPLKSKKGPIKIDAGKQGAIFLASFQKSAKKEFIIKVCPIDPKLKKQTAEIEYIIAKLLYKVIPRRVPKQYKFFKCNTFVPEYIWENKNSSKNYSKQTVTCMEYISNGTFDKYIERMSASPRRRLNDIIFRNFIHQVLMSLCKVQKKYPKFIHGDLHLRNLIVRPVRGVPQLVFTDFGWSKLNDSIGQFSEYKQKWAKEFGIGMNMCQMYDAHLFMSQLREWVMRNSHKTKDGLVATLEFLNKAVPKGFRKENDTHTKHSRIKYGHSYPFTLQQLLASDYFKKKQFSVKRPVQRTKIQKRISSPMNSNLLRVTPESVGLLTNNARTRRGLLIAYGAGPTPNKKNNISISVKASSVNKFKIKSPNYK